MTWKSDWWGITITADTKDDIKALNYFISKLDSKPTSSYEEGDLVIEDQNDGVVKAIFER